MEIIFLNHFLVTKIYFILLTDDLSQNIINSWRSIDFNTIDFIIFNIDDLVINISNKEINRITNLKYNDNYKCPYISFKDSVYIKIIDNNNLVYNKINDQPYSTLINSENKFNYNLKIENNAKIIGNNTIYKINDINGNVVSLKKN